MGRKSCWRLSVLLLLAGVAPTSASTGPLTPSAPIPILSASSKRRCRQAKSLLARALEEERRYLLASNSRRSHYATSQDANHSYGTLPVSAIKQVAKLPPLLWSKLREQRPPKNAGYYYGLMPDQIFPYAKRAEESEKDRQLAMTEALTETLEEMKNMRKELQNLRREMHEMRKKITGETDLEFEDNLALEVDPEAARLAKQKRQRQFDRLGREVEKWARKKLFEEDRLGNGWTEVPCNKMVGKTVNSDGRTTCYVGWMPDTRGSLAFPDDTRDYPAIKVYSTLDAPIEDVCTFLSLKEHMTDYNWILTEQRDLEEIAPHSKISLATSPQVLFIKPREFVTFCHHRWLKDGSVVIINQACDHKDAPPVKEEGKGKACRGYALRGATFISPDPQNPQRTRMAFISHAAPGGGLPQWAVKTAVGAIAPLEPFKLFNYINESLKKSKAELEKLRQERLEQPAPEPGRSNQPVGFAQIGYACFWPNGGGLMPPMSASPPVASSKEATPTEPAAAAAATTTEVASPSE